MLSSSRAYGMPENLDGGSQSGTGLLAAEQTRLPAMGCAGGPITLRDYEIRDGRLYQTVFRPRREDVQVDLGPALFVWPGRGGIWLECCRGGFGLPPFDEMRRDAWAGALATLFRRHGPNPGKAKGVLDYIWNASFHGVAVTPSGVFDAESPESMKALETCAVCRVCAHD